MRYCLIMESSWFLAAIKAEVILGLAQAEAGGRAGGLIKIKEKTMIYIQPKRGDFCVLLSPFTGLFQCSSVNVR